MGIKHSISTLICVLFLTGNISQAQETAQNNYTNRLIELGSNDSFFEILKLYNDSAACFEDEMRFYAQICIGNAFNRPELVIESIDSVYTYCPSGKYPSKYKYIKAKALLELGRYRELADYCQHNEKDSLSKIDPDYAWIEALTHQLAGTPDATINFPQSECTLSASRDFPLRISVQVNGIELPNTILDTGSPFTLLSYETAKNYNVRMFEDTVIVGSYFGPIKAVTGIIDELRVGDVVYHHTNVRVASPQSPDYFRYNNTLGIQELNKLSSVEFAPGRITLRKNRCQSALQPNVCFRNGHPYLRSASNGRIEEYLLDTGYDTNHLYTNDSIPDGTPAWRILSGHPVQFFTKRGFNDIAGKCHGTLGLPYTYNFESCLLDLDRMTFTGTGYRNIPSNYSMCINSGDFAHLDANLKWYEARTGEMGRWITNAFIGFVKNNPKMCIQYVDSLLNKYPNDLGPSFTTMQNIRAMASAYTGDFPSAIRFLKSCIEQNSSLLGSLNKCQAMLPIGAQEISWRTPTVTLPAKIDDNGWSVTAKINQKELELYFMPEKTECMISSKEAAKYQMQIIEYEEDSVHKEKIAIAKELILGNMTARNVMFSIDEEINGVYLGNSLLRMIPQYSLEKQQITLFKQPTPVGKKEVKYPLLMIQYTLCYYQPKGDDIEKIDIAAPNPTTKTITLKELLERNSKITVDSQNMYILFM